MPRGYHVPGSYFALVLDFGYALRGTFEALNLPDYWLLRPEMDLPEATRQAFDRLLTSVLASGPNAWIDYALPAPKWQFLCYAAEQHRLALHGSGDDGIERFAPRRSHDLHEFGNREAVFAAADGIWPMFYAILDRSRYAMSLSNACVRLVAQDGTVHGPYYVFSISQDALTQQPWRSGTVYLLPRTSFEEQPPIAFGDSQVHIPQLASLSPVIPLARLAVTPDDFPFLAQIRGHDNARLHEVAAAMQTGAPWPE